MVIEEEYEKQQANVEMKKQLCPYAAVGECRYGENCVYIHGDVCDMCGLQVLHPVDAAQRSQHIKVSIQMACVLNSFKLLPCLVQSLVIHSLSSEVDCMQVSQLTRRSTLQTELFPVKAVFKAALFKRSWTLSALRIKSV